MAMVNCVTSYIAFFFFTFISIEVSNSFNSKSLSCDQTNNCRCIQHSGDGVDLSPLISLSNTGQKFLTAATNGVMYFYHPCSNWPLLTKTETNCSHACGLCLFTADEDGKSEKLDVDSVLSNSVNGTFHLLGYASGGVFQSTKSDLRIVYKHLNFSTTILLDCEPNGAPTELAIWDPTASVDAYKNHTLILRSPYSCLRHLTPHTHYMSGAAVFFLIMFIFAAAYFFGGMLVLRSIKGATGTEMIPNYDFWITLPGRIKNGFMRLIGRGGQGADTYERI